jgi:hypothetical protein
MSTAQASRGQRGGTSTRAGRGTSTTTNRGRGNVRGNFSSRGRGRGASSADTNGTPKASTSGAGGLLQQLRDGNARRGVDNRPKSLGRSESGWPQRFKLLADLQPEGGIGESTPSTPAPHGRGTRATTTPGFRGRGRGRGSGSTPETSSESRPPKSAAGPQRDFMNAKFSEFQTVRSIPVACG